MFDSKVFYQYLFQLFAYGFATWFFWDLLLKCMRARWFLRLSTCLLINIILDAVTTTVGVFMNVYLILGMGQEKSGPVMFITHVIFGNLLYMCYISTMLLMVDRILALVIPFLYRRHYKMMVTCKVLICLVGGLIYSSLTFVEWPVEQVTTCDVFLCLLKISGGFSNSLMKMGLGIVTMCVSLFFYFCIKSYVGTTTRQHQLKNLNILIGASVTNECLCIFIPQLVKAISSALKIPVWEILGTYVSIGSSINALTLALVYRFLIKDPGQRTAGRVTPVRSVQMENVTVL